MHRLVRLQLMKFYYVYVLKSLRDINLIYVGYTEDLIKRIKSHNQFENISTKKFAPFSLIHYEAYRHKADAKHRELYLKTTKDKTALRTMLREFFKSQPVVLEKDTIPDDLPAEALA